MKMKDYLDSHGYRYNFKAKEWGVTPQYLNELMYGKAYPSLKTALRIEILTKGEVSCYDWIDPKELPEINQQDS
jgi:DNA-binding transcriptional regulator YdaS (Cro superfamily)